MSSRTQGELLFAPPLVGLEECSLADANRLLGEWGHYLGPVNRPFGAQGWVLSMRGGACAVAVSCSTVSATVASAEAPRVWRRAEVVELARLCSADRTMTRVMLRLWREVCAREWPYWPVRAAVAYSQNSRHEGDIYRFDGWKRATATAGSSGGGTWSAKRDGSHAAKGRKSLWVYEYGATR